MNMKLIKPRVNKKSKRRSEKGQALVIVLALMVVGIMIITSTLAFLGTSLKTNKIYINNTNDLYAAEAGVQDGIYKVLNKSNSELNNLLTPVAPNVNAFTEYDYNLSGWNYPLPNQVNNDNVTVNVKNLWIPLIDDNNTGWVPSVNNLLPPDGNITPPSASKANNIKNNTNLLVTGGVYSIPLYSLNITAQGDAVSLPITSIGVWLPQGFTYDNRSSNLEKTDTSPQLYTNEQVVKCAGNQAVIWTFSNTTYASLLNSLNSLEGNNSVSITITFRYTTSLQKIPEALGWIVDNTTTNTTFPYAYTWNMDIKVYDLISIGRNPGSTHYTEVESYVPKSATRTLGAALSGDYVAVGNSLLKMNGYDDHGVRSVLVSPSSATVATIPSDANVQGAYLYWAGWLNSSSKHLGNSYGARVNFQINGNQVYFNSNGDPARGSTALTSSMNQTQTVNLTGNNDYSYSCYNDVTKLVQWELQQETSNTSNPGNATYSISPGSGCTLANTGGQGQEAAYAGWSLIIIYSSPATLGHQLYLYDDFVHAAGNLGNNHNGSDIDPTGNTSGPGGVISGFIVPDRITGEVDAAKFTAFVGEGDFVYSGDFVAFNIPKQYQNPIGQYTPWTLSDSSSSKLWDGITVAAPGSSINLPGEPHLPNTAAQPDNVWNGYSQTGLADGVDIKTFHVPWESGLLKPGDTSARIDLPTQIDGWDLIYMIFSFRSSVTSNGAISYIIRRK